jgi:ATP-binding cassette subfamily F protein 3
MIKLEDISLSYGEQVVFDEESCNISPHQKIGLVGRNGAGKSTLLKVIVGQQHIDSGSVYMPKTFKCAYMSQDVILMSERTSLHEAVCSTKDIEKLVDELHEVETLLTQDPGNYDLLERYAHVHGELNEIDYENKIVKAKKILTGLGFGQEQLDEPVSKLSVGWKTRLVLAKLLLQNADFYLFDEPTNHLDLIAKDWFAEFLRNANFGFILVSHDRYFLDTVCDYICDISMGKLVFYTGNYSKYIEQKEENKAVTEKKYEEQQKFIKKRMETIDRFKAKASKAKMAQSMLRQLDKIEKVEVERDQSTIKFRLATPPQSGKTVLTANKLSFSFGEKNIFENVSFEIGRASKVAIVAPNGTGKSTLLNVLMGKLTPKSGKFELGYNVKAAFFEQDQNKSLNPDNTILAEVESVCKTEESRKRMRAMLGAFLFSGDDVFKRISVLSGGEKNRVAMVKILLQDANFLILDEPTNHLDIQSKNVLLEVLSKYEGTILFVSHDRSFLNSLSTDILELTHEGISDYKGNYDEYLYHKQYMENLKASFAKDDKDKLDAGKKKDDIVGKEFTNDKNNDKKNDKNSYNNKKELKKIELSIEKLEKEIADLIIKFEKLNYGSREYYEAEAKLKELQEMLKDKNKIWESTLI